MRKTLIAAIAATMLLGCGKDSTGPGDDGNPNPNPQHYTITVNGGVFTPDTLPQSGSPPVYVGDVILWTVDDSDPGEHQITFTDVPGGVQTQPTDTLTAGLSDSTIFLKAGTYKYAEVIDQGGGVRGSGVLIVSPLP
jgi:plastocyanin